MNRQQISACKMFFIISSVWFDQIKVAACTFDDQRVRVVFVIFAAEGSKVHIPEIHTMAGRFVDLRRERYVVSRDDLAAFVVTPGVSDMSKVRGDAEVFFELAGFGH